MFDENEEKKGAAKILFIIFAIVFAVYIILLRHSKTYAQVPDAGIKDAAVDAQFKDFDSGSGDSAIDASVQATVAPGEENKKDEIYVQVLDDLDISKDPLFGLGGDSEPDEFFVDKDNPKEERLIYLNNPLFKNGYTRDDFVTRYDYQYFLWREYQPPPEAAQIESNSEEKRSLKSYLKYSVLQHLMHCIKRQDGKGVLLKSCRASKGGCEKHVAMIVGHIVDVSTDLHLNPYVLTALALHYSNFDPYDKKTHGDFGIFELNSEEIKSKIKFFTNKWHRLGCKKQIGNCQKEIVEAAGIRMYKFMRLCNENLNQAIYAFHRGTCSSEDSSNSIYVKKIKRLAKTLKSGCAPSHWCDGSSSEEVYVPYNEHGFCYRNSL